MTAKQFRGPAGLAIFLLAASLSDVALASEAPKPKLVLQITVDQLRGDLPRRVYDRLGEGGFRYLFDNGTVYDNAHHRHANTETIVGHSTLATGADPSAHGMIGNVWLDRETGELSYNIEDARYRILTVGADVDESTEIDPTQRAARTDGRSPAPILVSTFSDELRLFYGEDAKIFGVSVKDRGAVALAGHGGKAFWFSKATGEFVSSSFYYDRYPSWVERWNRERHADRWDESSWELSGDPASYDARDDRPYEQDLAGFSRTFPHPYGDKDGKYYTTLLTISPAGDELTLDFAKAVVRNEGLGKDDTPDYLSVSFSSTDYVGHIFGPSSLESEDNLLRLDRTLAELLRFIDEEVGLDQTLVVLSADHGGAEAPGYLNELGIEAQVVDPTAWDKQPAIEALKRQFGLGEELIQTYFHPYVYLNRKVIEEKGLDRAEVERAVAREMMKFDAVALAVSSSALAGGDLPDTPLIDRVLRNFNPRRSGDVYVVFEPHCFVADMDGLTVATTHGSPWSYDTYVPIVFAGPGIPGQRVARRVETVDLAVTLAAAMGTKPPSGASGTPLVEVLGASSATD
jgi:predicted AlkP superfamily pyrophosphatase or phosphodiesterase